MSEVQSLDIDSGCFWGLIRYEISGEKVKGVAKVRGSRFSKTHLFLNLSIIASETRKPAFRSSKAT